MKLGQNGSISGHLVAGLCLIAFVTGCAKKPQVRSDALPVRKVVVYRNGVAYFERSGEVEEANVEFQLREENVGDFLATLAIMERGGHTVRAASFPVSLADQDRSAPDPELQAALEAWERKESDPRELRTVSLELDGEKHDLTVGYLAETPLWRPSYRLVVGDDGEASLQVWGIVQNQSGEDWDDIELSLVAGAPIAFESTLGQPVIPERPLVTDEGEVIAAVPEGQTSYHREESAESEPAMSAAAPKDDDVATKPESKARKNEQHLVMAPSDRPALEEETGVMQAPERAPGISASTLRPRSGRNLAQIQVQSGATRYEVPHQVTVPDESATMVLLVSEKVPGKAIHLYAPDPGVPDSRTHPFRVVRFKNESGGLLEKGPIAVFEEGAFLGQGVLQSLPVKAEATVPFAVVRDVAVERSISHDRRGVRFYAVRNGTLFIERDRAKITTYEVQNGDQEAAHLLIRHPRRSGSELHDPPKGTEDNIAEGVALVPAVVPKFGETTVTIEERRPHQSKVAWESVEARRAIKKVLAAEWLKASQKKTLQEIDKHASALSDVAHQEAKLRGEQRELEKNTRETRLSLQAIEENPQAGGLRRELTQRLREGTQRLEEITKELVELGLRRSELEVRLKQARQSLEIPARDEDDKK